MFWAVNLLNCYRFVFYNKIDSVEAPSPLKFLGKSRRQRENQIALPHSTLSSTMLSLDQSGADLHLFQTRFVIGWENNRDGDKTMPLSLKTIGSESYRRIFADVIVYIFLH